MSLTAFNPVSMIADGRNKRYVRRSQKFMDAYYRKLNGKQAAWASKKYRGHRVLPESLMDEILKANIE